jgi:hypothetical protein
MKREEPSTESRSLALQGTVVFRTSIAAMFGCPSPPDRGLSQSGCQAFTGTRRRGSERPWSRVV